MNPFPASALIRSRDSVYGKDKSHCGRLNAVRQKVPFHAGAGRAVLPTAFKSVHGS